MTHLPLELIVLLETDPEVRALAEQFVSAEKKWQKVISTHAKSEWRPYCKVEFTEMNKIQAQWHEARSAWRAAYHLWYAVDIRDLEEWLNGASTLRTDRPARD